MIESFEGNVMRNVVIATLLAAGLLSGCVVHISEDGISSGYEGSRGDSWRERQARNRKAIARLELGTPVDEVTRMLGEPDFSEAFSSADGDYRVLFYRTHHRHSDGETTRDETTPVVFMDGRVYGFGDDFYRRLMGN
jgi:outer membrane protein assembly factor BamE (lipoprotein component of BamABCDE complex)